MNSRGLKNLRGETLPNARMISGMIRTLARGVMTHKGDFHRLSLQVEPIETLQEKFRQHLFEAAMALGRQHEQSFVSIGRQDLISNRYDGKWPWNDRIWAWDAAEVLGVNAGCGNGKGDLCGQYQIYGTLFFDQRHFGVWNPKDETRILEEAFDLETSSALCDGLTRAIRAGKTEQFLQKRKEYAEKHQS